MSTTTAPASPSFLSDIEGFFSFIGKSIQTWFASPTGQTVTDALASVAGTAAGYELIANVKSSSPGAVANDMMVIGTAAVAELSATTPPTVIQLQNVFTALKSNESTDLFIPLAQAAATSIASFIGTNDGGQTSSGKWQPVAQAFIQGMMNAAAAYGATVPAATPVTA